MCDVSTCFYRHVEAGRNGAHFVSIMFYDVFCSETQREHLALLTTQLLGREKLSMKWSDLILCLVRRITHLVQPDLRTDGREMDIRHYVKIKKVTTAVFGSRE